MALVYVDNDPWLTEHDACEKLLREIREQLTLRSREPKTSHNYAKLSSSIRLRMKQYANEVQQLKEKLLQASARRTLTIQEAERRSRLVEYLQSQNVLLERQFVDRENGATASRSNLFNKSGPVLVDMGVTGWGTDDVEEEDDRTQSEQHMSPAEFRQKQQRMLREQDEGLDALSKVISRQKEIAKTIGNEVDVQNEIIDDLAENMDQTDARLIDETSQIKIITRKDRTCWYWVIIVLLFIGIIVAATV